MRLINISGVFWHSVAVKLIFGNWSQSYSQSICAFILFFSLAAYQCDCVIHREDKYSKTLQVGKPCASSVTFQLSDYNSLLWCHNFVFLFSLVSLHISLWPDQLSAHLIVLLSLVLFWTVSLFNHKAPWLSLCWPTFLTQPELLDSAWAWPLKHCLLGLCIFDSLKHRLHGFALSESLACSWMATFLLYKLRCWWVPFPWHVIAFFFQWHKLSILII